MSRRRLETDEATTVRIAPGRDDQLPAGLLPSLDDHPGPARRIASSKSAAMVASIVEAAMRDAPAPIEIKPEPRPAVRSAPRRLIPVLAAALVAAAVVGAAAAVITTRYFTPAQAPKASPPSAPAAPAPAPTVTPTVPAEIEMEASAPIEARPRRKPAPPSRDHKVLPPDAAPEDVLALANQRRKERAWRDADQLYRRVIKSHPRSDAAIVAEVASATIHLEHLEDAAGALAGYRRALRARPGGALGEEARWGIAEAYRARGDARQEATALRLFLDAHPGSAMASAARKRLAELAR